MRHRGQGWLAVPCSGSCDLSNSVIVSIGSANSPADLLMKGGDSGHESSREKGDKPRQKLKLGCNHSKKC